MDSITAELVRALLPRRDPGGHKGTFGKVCVYGGCVGYTMKSAVMARIRPKKVADL